MNILEQLKLAQHKSIVRNEWSRADRTVIGVIHEVGEDWVGYKVIGGSRGESYQTDSKHFPGAKIGQEWRIGIEYPGQYPTGQVVAADLIID